MNTYAARIVGAEAIERNRIRSFLIEHVPPILKAGHSVVFDFGGNTVRDRSFVRSVVERAAGGRP
jgi:hypothetical protein